MLDDMFCPMDVEAQRVVRESFSGRIDAVELGQVRLVRVATSAINVKRRPEHIAQIAAPPYLIKFPLKGDCLWTQRGRQVHARPGDFLICSTSEPYTLTFPGEYEMPVMVVPNAVMRRLTPDPEQFLGQRMGAEDADCGLLSSFVAQIVARMGRLSNPMVHRIESNVLDLLGADFTYVNERLARHYRMPNVYGAHFRRVTVADDARRGLLGKGGILLVTSHADRTSPVVRGKWILDNLIGTPPPPPPAEVPAFPDATPGGAQTVRARMAQHRASPACASCHRVMDPLGLALENFDAVGAWRTEEAGVTVDASGELGDGRKLDGVGALRQALLDRPDVFVGTMAEKLLTYALGRDLEPVDMPAVRAIVSAARRDGYRFSSLVRAVVASVPFQMRRTAPEA